MLVMDYLEETARRFPDKPAFVGTSEVLSFQELRTEAYMVATRIIREDFRRKPVLILLDKSPRCLAAFYGVAYSGNFYSPADVDMPEERLKKIVDILRPAAILTEKKYVEKAMAVNDINSVILEMEDIADIEPDDTEVEQRTGTVTDADVLYVIFTSGSTGTPKGVIIPHRSVIDYVEWFVGEFHITSADNLGNQSPLHFDLSIQDVYATIRSGCTTYLIDRPLFSFPVKLMEYLCEKKISVIMWVPSALCAVANLKGLRVKQLPKLRLVLFCGEVMPNKQLNMWRNAFQETVFANLYGPSETCDASAFYIVDREFLDDEPLPIGRACRNTDIIVLDEEEREVKDGAIGELCIRGSSLAYGYYNDPEKTREAFVQNPLNMVYPEKIYRTGDLVRYNEYGELLYVSRKDHQIKHLGHRIELGEIETAAISVEGVQTSCCHYDGKRDLIILYYTGVIKEKSLFEQLEKKVPHYMVPYKIYVLDSMPMNHNGKIDRKELEKIWEQSTQKMSS